MHLIGQDSSCWPLLLTANQMENTNELVEIAKKTVAVQGTVIGSFCLTTKIHIKDTCRGLIKVYPIFHTGTICSISLHPSVQI